MIVATFGPSSTPRSGHISLTKRRRRPILLIAVVAVLVGVTVLPACGSRSAQQTPESADEASPASLTDLYTATDEDAVNQGGKLGAEPADAVKEDSSGPRTSVRYAISVGEGERARIDYVIDDSAPNVKASIRIAGPTTRTFKLGTVSTGWRHRFTLPGSLAAGTYKVTVLAVDPAGNLQSVASSSTLVVRAASPSASGSGSGFDYGGGGSYTVYVTDTGEKYHAAGCSYLSESSSPMSRSGAEAAGYAPCSVCNP